MPLSIKDVRGILLQLFPPGQLYDWYTPASKVSRFLDGLAEALKTLGYDLVDRLRRELNPATAIDKLADWETALGIAWSYTARNGTVVQRQAAVVGKLREFGAFTLANARAILAPLLGYVDSGKLLIVETDRVKMRAAHSYSDGASHAPATFIVARAYVFDGGIVSRAGAQLDLELQGSSAAPFVIYLASPSNRVKTWASASLPRSTKYRLFAPEFAGDVCGGTWTVILIATAFGAAAPGIARWSLFVEGAGRNGLSGDLCSFGVYLDPQLAGKNGTPADPEAVRAAIARIEHAHSDGAILTSLLAIPDDPTSLPDACLPG